MSLMQLLAVGRSIGTIRNAPSRYRMRQQNLLPRFGTGKGLEGTEAESKSGLSRLAWELDRADAPIGGTVSATSQQKPESVTDQGMKQATLEQSQNNAETVSGKFRRVASPRRGWSLLRNPFQPRTRPGRAAGPVQGELALDLIKPVRNDLNDTDLELVPCRNKPTRAETGAVAPKSSRMLELVGAVWGRLRMGLFRIRTKQT